MNTQIIALFPTDLAPAQQSLISWCDQRIEHWIKEQGEAKDAYAYAVKQKWNASRFRTQMQKANRKIEFYRKVRRAIELGYLIVPNLPLDIIAIRTNAIEARGGKTSTSKWTRFEQMPKNLPSGEGRYTSPKPAIYSDERAVKDGKTETFYYPAELSEELELPVRLQKPQVLQAIDQARAHKLFDQIGVCSDASADPIVCGVIRESNSFSGKRLTFFLAWYINLADI
jgi:hypothetical protein